MQTLLAYLSIKYTSKLVKISRFAAWTVHTAELIKTSHSHGRDTTSCRNAQR